MLRGSPCVKPSRKVSSKPPQTNNLDSTEQKLFTYAAISGQMNLMLCRTTFRFRLLKPFAASTKMAVSEFSR